MILTAESLTESDKKRLDVKGIESLIQITSDRLNRGHYAKSDEAELKAQLKEYYKMLAMVK